MASQFTEFNDILKIRQWVISYKPVMAYWRDNTAFVHPVQTTLILNHSKSDIVVLEYGLR